MCCAKRGHRSEAIFFATMMRGSPRAPHQAQHPLLYNHHGQEPALQQDLAAGVRGCAGQCAGKLAWPGDCRLVAYSDCTRPFQRDMSYGPGLLSTMYSGVRWLWEIRDCRPKLNRTLAAARDRLLMPAAGTRATSRASTTRRPAPGPRQPRAPTGQWPPRRWRRPGPWRRAR